MTFEVEIYANLVCPHGENPTCEIRINSAGKDPMYNVIVLSDSQIEFHRSEHSNGVGMMMDEVDSRTIRKID